MLRNFFVLFKKAIDNFQKILLEKAIYYLIKKPAENKTAYFIKSA